jgi:hypothetical protein
LEGSFRDTIPTGHSQQKHSSKSECQNWAGGFRGVGFRV